MNTDYCSVSLISYVKGYTHELGIEDKNFINFRIQNSDVTRIVDGLEVT